MGLKTCSPNRTSLETEPPRWLMPWISLFLTSSPLRKAASATMSDAFKTPCPPRPAITMLVTLLLLLNVVLFLRCRRLFVSFDLARGQQAVAARDDDRQLFAGEACSHQFLERGGIECRVGD